MNRIPLLRGENSISPRFQFANLCSISLSRQTSDNPTQGTPEKDGRILIPPTPAPERQTSESTAAASEVHIVSNARGPYPQLEMFSVPRRSHTVGHMHRGHAHESRENRPFNRIMRKLSDVRVFCPWLRCD